MDSEQLYKQAAIDTALLYQSAIKLSSSEYTRGQIDIINTLLNELEQQQRDGFKKAQIFKIIKQYGGEGFNQIDLTNQDNKKRQQQFQQQ